MRKLRVAVLDMNNNVPNQGLRGIQNIVNTFPEDWESKTYNVRDKAEIPDTTYDIYMVSGGPGSPFDGDGNWDIQFFDLINTLWQHNIECDRSQKGTKKYVFLICHAFQMVVNHFGMAAIQPRNSMSFGIFPVHKTAKGTKERLFEELPDPFYAADFREWQVVQPQAEVFAVMGAEILALEKIRPNVPFERAIMAIRFSKEFFGTQFHPEGEPVGMLQYFRQDDKKQHIIDNHGRDKYDEMVDNIHHPKRITLTYDVLIPNFLKDAVKNLKKQVAIQDRE